MGSDKSKNISISAELYNKIEQRVNDTGFGSVNEYVTFVLDEIIKDEVEEQPLSKKEEKEVKDRLKALGYME